MWRDDSHRLNGRHFGARLGEGGKGELRDVVKNVADLHCVHICQFTPRGLFLPLLHCALLGFHLVLTFHSSASGCVGPESLQVVVCLVRKLNERFPGVDCNVDLFANFCQDPDSIAASFANSCCARSVDHTTMVGCSTNFMLLFCFCFCSSLSLSPRCNPENFQLRSSDAQPNRYEGHSLPGCAEVEARAPVNHYSTAYMQRVQKLLH